MKTSIFLLLVFVLLFLYRVEVATLVLRPSRLIDRSINWLVVIKAPYALTTKSDLELFSPVTSSDEDITIFRGYYCKYQLAERPVRQGIICEMSSKRASQISKQKHNRTKHFGWHWLFKVVTFIWFDFSTLIWKPLSRCKLCCSKIGFLRTVPPFVTAHTFCTSQDIWVSKEFAT